MEDLVIGFFGVSLVLYCLFAGADFGAGILELFRGKEKRREQSDIITKAMGPVWEANHMWLILAIVILFNGFPAAYATLSVVYHIPLTLMLTGIILRGCAFTFRHYDAVKDRSQKVYSVVFAWSSLLTPMTIGMMAGGAFMGRLTMDQSLGYWAVYFAPWCNGFAIAVGFFVSCLFSFLAAVYLIDETDDKDLRSIFITRAKWSNASCVVSGLAVFGWAYLNEVLLMKQFFLHFESIACMSIATCVLFPLWRCLHTERSYLARRYAALQIVLVLFAWFRLQFPHILILQDQELTFYSTIAPAVTLRYLCLALLGGSLAIFPALYYLFRVFKFSRS